MSKSRFALMVLVAALLAGAVQLVGQGPGGAPQSLGSIGPPAQRFEVTEQDRAAAQELAKKLLALDISPAINTTAQSTLDGTIGGRGGARAGAPGGMPGGMPGARAGAPGGMPGGMPGARGAQPINEPPYPPTPASQEAVEKLVFTLQSPTATRMQKSDALRQLSVVGTKDIVPMVAALLGDAELSHMARYALEPIPDPSVDVAFREALGKVQGRQLLGVIISVGVRRDAQAVEPLTRMLQNPDAEVAQAAAASLGRIGNAAAAKALQSAVASAPAANRAAFSEALFRCAESLASQGQDASAVAIYDQLLKMDAPAPIRTAALRGAILARKANGVAVLQQHLQGSDQTLFVAAVRTAQEMTVAGTTQALTDALAKRSLDSDKILIIATLGSRGDAAAVPALLPLAQAGSKSVRLAAMQALPQVPQAASVPVLVALMNNADAEIAAAAKASFATMPGNDADAAVVAMLKSSQARDRIAGMEMAATRSIRATIPDLLQIAGSNADPKVRQAALKAAGNMAGAADLPALVEVVLTLKTSEDLDAAVTATRSALANVEDKTAFAQTLLTRLGQAQPAQKSALIRLLSITGGTQALGAVQSALGDSNKQVQAAALQAFADWPDFQAVKPLIDISAKSSTSMTDSVLALRGALRLIRSSTTAPMEERANLCMTAYDIARRIDERREAISVMGNIRSAAVGNKLIEIATKDPALKTEAGTAAIQVITILYTGQMPRGGRRGGAGGPAPGNL
jgi:HEAT repeat protein